jgi:tryptophanyl-tRNA synthetase
MSIAWTAALAGAKSDADKNLAIQLRKLVAPVDIAADFGDASPRRRLRVWRFEEGLFDHYWNFFAPMREKRAD